MSDAIEAVLLPCPFCGGAAEWYDITEDDEVGNAGGSCITCTKCQACGPVQFGEKDTIVEQWNRRPALTAYEAAKGGGVGVKPVGFARSVDVDPVHRPFEGQTSFWCSENQNAYYSVPVFLTSPASGSGTREEIKGAVGRETEGWPAETDHVPSPASGERDAPQCCMCGKNGLSTTEGDGGAECELADGRWVCSQACYDKAVPMPGGERDAVIDYTKAAERLLRARPFGDATIGKYLGLEDNYHSTAVMARALAAALRMEGSAVTASDESDE